MIRYNIERHMHRKGWTTAYQLALHAGVTQPAAHRVMAGEPLQRIEVATLEKLAVAFRVKPWTLLEYEPE
jgi:DNA-binding Xre family transcriptional regulator